MKTFNIMYLLFCLILMTSCNKKAENNDINYFDFDDLEYYHKDISQNDILTEYVKSRTANYDESYLKIVQNEYPSVLNDSEFLSNMINFGYVKMQIEKSKHSQINKIFSKNSCKELTANGCIPTYRDIFVFKRKGKVIGIAKICYECRFAYIIGSKQNWDYFGECGDYEKLQEIIKTIK